LGFLAPSYKASGARVSPLKSLHILVRRTSVQGAFATVTLMSTEAGR
jgi:hypothetical protein